MRIRRLGSESTLFLLVAATLAGLAWADAAQAPGTSVAARPDAVSGPPAAAPDVAPAEVVTRASVAMVAGRLDATKRQRVKDVVAGIVDDYLDGAFVSGTYPREDFSAAFADFRDGAAATATQDLDLLTNHDVGAQLTGVRATHRRVRIDVLAPQGRPGAATARFVLDLDLTGAPTPTQRVVGSLFLTNQRGAWRVFGYDVRKEATS